MLGLRRKRKRKREPSPLVLADRARDAADWALAARHYREALARASGNPAIWVQYGHALKEGGNLAEAEKAYRQAIAIDSRSADSHLQLGHVLKLQGRREDAVAAYFHALEHDPASPAAVELIALCWQCQEPIRKLEAGWNQHLPAFLNCIASVNAFAHEQARLMREVEQLRRDVEALKSGLTAPPEAIGASPSGANLGDARAPEARAAMHGRSGPPL